MAHAVRVSLPARWVGASTQGVFWVWVWLGLGMHLNRLDCPRNYRIDTLRVIFWTPNEPFSLKLWRVTTRSHNGSVW